MATSSEASLQHLAENNFLLKTTDLLENKTDSQSKIGNGQNFPGSTYGGREQKLAVTTRT